MSRDLKINILVDDQEAVQKLNAVADAEDRVTSSATKTSVALDESQSQFKATSVSTAEADRYLSDLHSTFSRMPSTLSNMRTGLNDLAGGLGITVTELGLVNAAGLVVGTAIGAWKLGTAIGEWTGLTRAISDDTAALLGWGNVAAETAAAKAEVLARASDSAGMEITQLSAAMAINAQTALTQEARVTSVARGLLMAEEASKSMRHELVEYLAREQVRWDAEDRATQQKIRRDAEELAGFREKLHAIENGGDHAFSTLHQWYGEMHRDQQHMNDLADQNIKKLAEAQQAAQQFLVDALNAARAIDAELAANPIGHGPTTPNDGSSLNPSPIVVRPIGPIQPPSGIVGQNTNTTLRTFAEGGPTGPGGMALLHPNEFVVPQGGALVKSGGSTIVINIDAKGSSFENDRALDRLVAKVADKLGAGAVSVLRQ